MLEFVGSSWDPRGSYQGYIYIVSPRPWLASFLRVEVAKPLAGWHTKSLTNIRSAFTSEPKTLDYGLKLRNYQFLVNLNTKSTFNKL